MTAQSGLYLPICPWAYEATLSVTDGTCLTGSAGAPIIVCEPLGQETNEPSVSKITATPDPSPSPLTVNFNGLESSDPDGSIKSYQWILGDGSIATGVSLLSTYLDEAIYSVILSVADGQDKSNSFSKTTLY